MQLPLKVNGIGKTLSALASLGCMVTVYRALIEVNDKSGQLWLKKRCGVPA